MNRASLPRTERAFVALVWDFYETHGRHELPWRTTTDPYHILVSELMLQQTQVARVIPKYEAFLERWPTIGRLAAASLADVLVAWQGLGYNRRAKYLHRCAQVVATEFTGQFPRTETELQKLPGVGPYTAAAIVAFAYDEPVTLIETNVRRVFLHHFFADSLNVPDLNLLPIIARTTPATNVRAWYAALMDYGSYLKQTSPNTNQRSMHYVKQSKFSGSDRQIRGAILRFLATRPSACRHTIIRGLSAHEPERVRAQLTKLEAEGMLRTEEGSIRLG